MQFFRPRSTTTRPSDATAYAAGDEVSNSATAGSVVRATFDLSGFTRGRILGACMDITPASGNFINTASDVEVLIFKTTDVPAAVGDNVTNPIVAATQVLAIGAFRFDDAGWTGQLGSIAGTVTSAYQRVGTHVVNPLATPGLQALHVPGFPFDFLGNTLAQRSLSVVIRALAAWTPSTVINTLGITLDLEVG
jgi:hypothetical protein